WAISIMDFTYSLVHQFIDNSPHPPPFQIPNIRFVHAGVAIAHEQTAGPVSSSKSTIVRPYLIEEFFDESKDGFHKFFNNGSAIP
ncbi:hypothetical protein C8J57DRAFT_1040824, partial [Mycena rebaudengoi]